MYCVYCVFVCVVFVLCLRVYVCGVCVVCAVLVAQWIRHPPTKREIAGSSPVEDSLFSFAHFFVRSIDRVSYVCCLLSVRVLLLLSVLLPPMPEHTRQVCNAHQNTQTQTQTQHHTTACPYLFSHTLDACVYVCVCLCLVRLGAPLRGVGCMRRQTMTCGKCSSGGCRSGRGGRQSGRCSER